MTKKLYYNDPYRMEFSEKIIDQKKYNDFYAVIFEQTFFYPSSGGQEHDFGSINGMEVINVIEEDNKILHVVKEKITDEKATCIINWERRFDFMQQHSGQHILSETIQKLFGYGTVSSHLGEISSTIDINTQSFNFEKMKEIEILANEIIYKNLQIKIHYISDSEISKYPLRKKPKFSGELRIIEIDDFDYSACGGTHCRYTGEVGIIKIKKWEKVKGDLTRLEFLCGRRALSDYQMKNFYISDLSNKFTIKDNEIYDKVLKLIDENKKSNKVIELYKSELLKYEATSLLKEATNEKGINILKKIFENREINDVRYLAQQIILIPDSIVIFGIFNEESNLILARSANIDINLKSIYAAVSNLYSLKGGGKPDFIQAGFANQNLVEILDFIYRNIEL